MDSIIEKPLLVARRVGGTVTLYAEVVADPCPTIQWSLNGSAVSSGGDYLIGNPCSNSPAGTTSFNFTLSITATTRTAGMYNAALNNPAGTTEVPDVFVTPPGTCSMLALLVTHLFLFCFVLCSSSSHC